MEKHDARDRHQGGSARQDCRDRRQRAATLKQQKKATVPAPTQRPVNTEYQKPAGLKGWFHRPEKRRASR